MIDYLTLATKAYLVKSKIENNSSLLKKLEDIVPGNACIKETDIGVYELDATGQYPSIKNSGWSFI